MRGVLHWLCVIVITIAGLLVATRSDGETPKRIVTEAASAELAAPRLQTHDARVAAIALRFLNDKPRLRREDCSGFIEAVLDEAESPRRGSVRMFWSRALHEGRAYRAGMPTPGHLAFFDTSYDANGNGAVDDTLTHIAIVTAVNSDGTIELVHRPRAGIRRLRMQLRHPASHRHDGKVINDHLRSRHFGHQEGRRLAAQLLYGFAAPPTPAVATCRCACHVQAKSAGAI